jgi:16S rRNA (cytidine1402-2'-O)-methyltransferase
MKSGKLTLIPTPIDSESKLNVEAFSLLNEAAQESDKYIFLVEDPKPSRRRWLHFGLPREIISEFVYFNEQSSDSISDEIIKEIKNGKDAFLMSDAGLPAFCDPGAKLIDRCHESGITVTCTPFFNSISLALALSGFSHHQFIFHGFVERKAGKREEFLRDVIKNPLTGVLMDTPYRLKSLLEAIVTIEKHVGKRRQYCLAQDLGKKSEKILRGAMSDVIKKVQFSDKPEFILLIRNICP